MTARTRTLTNSFGDYCATNYTTATYLPGFHRRSLFPTCSLSGVQLPCCLERTASCCHPKGIASYQSGNVNGSSKTHAIHTLSPRHDSINALGRDRTFILAIISRLLRPFEPQEHICRIHTDSAYFHPTTHVMSQQTCGYFKETNERTKSMRFFAIKISFFAVILFDNICPPHPDSTPITLFFIFCVNRYSLISGIPIFSSA